MNKYTGGCACGAVRYQSKSEPLASFHCQCRQCQRASGTGHASLIAVPAKDVAVQGALSFYDQTADDGSTVSRGFCQLCGSPVLGKTTGHPDILLIAAGSLDDPSIFEPEKIVWSCSKQPWDFVDPQLPSF
jgi:hypothetical protein